MSVKQIKRVQHEEPPLDSPHEQTIGHLKPGNTHVPFAGQSHKVRAAVRWRTGVNPGKEEVIEELWEDPAGFDVLDSLPKKETQEGLHRPRKSLRTVPPLHSRSHGSALSVDDWRRHEDRKPSEVGAARREPSEDEGVNPGKEEVIEPEWCTACSQSLRPRWRRSR